MHPRSPGLSAAAMLLALGLTGCGGSGSSAGASSAATSDAAPSEPGSSEPGSSGTRSSSEAGTPTDGASPAAGQLVGEGYSVALPDRWEDATEQFKEYSNLIDAGALNADQAGQPFSDNVNVLRNADQVELPEIQAEHQFSEELGTVATRVEVQPEVTLDGVDALHLTGRTEAGEVTALTHQYIAYVGGAYYVVTFSYGTGTPRAQREREIASMLDSWSWG